MRHIPFFPPTLYLSPALAHTSRNIFCYCCCYCDVREYVASAMHYSNLDRNEMISLLWLAFWYENKETKRKREREARAANKKWKANERTHKQ